MLRLRGLDAVPPVSLPRASPVPLATLTPRQVRTELARRTLAAQGLAECVTFSFMAQSEAALFGDTPEALRLTNPIAADLDQLRPTPIATLALAAQRNAARGYPDVALFEIGPEFAIDARGEPALDRRRPARRRDAAQLARRRRDRSMRWTPRPICGPSMAAIGVPLDALVLTQDAPGFYHPGRSATVRQGPKTVLGSFGELHPRVLAALDLAGPVAAFELDLDAVGDPKRRRKAAPDLPPFQPIRRDFAFLVDSAVTADAVLRAARGADRALISRRVAVRCLSGRAPAGRQEVAGDRGGVPAARAHADRCRDRGCQPEGGCRGGKGDRRHAALIASAAWHRAMAIRVLAIRRSALIGCALQSGCRQRRRLRHW